ncbi:MAG TPA: hypothetical protein VHB77_05920, partial [Planctomycetaceae bacterium]|nr:hypothetical protein [Planctomycetaceae bacterium]
LEGSLHPTTRLIQDGVATGRALPRTGLGGNWLPNRSSCVDPWAALVRRRWLALIARRSF